MYMGGKGKIFAFQGDQKLLPMSVGVTWQANAAPDTLANYTHILSVPWQFY